ncbi:hypothetical protein GCM10022403_024560 [Streptomyces coacervatus]|uniref:Uncharacterized protein n=1 Tax=Streptomyces coacervatus TaxID=647381 RepID=A0ABP7HFH9_9ACTN
MVPDDEEPPPPDDDAPPPPDEDPDDASRPYCKYRKSTATAASHQTWFPNPKTTRTTVPDMTMVPMTGLRLGVSDRAVLVCPPDGALGEGRPSVGA